MSRENMYRILIIDDEAVVRESISENVDWGGHGFELVGACRDGREGLEAIEELAPDVVFTDICMPFVDGLELAAAIGDRYPDVRTLLLTGYDDFEYAQEAVRLKVHDFLLKPITADELTTKLDALRVELDLERDRKRKFHRLQEQVKASLPVYRERFLNRLIAAPIPEGELARTEELLELDLPGPRFIALVCDLDPPTPEEPQLTSLGVQNVFSALADASWDIVAFSTPGEEAVAIVSVAASGEATTRALETAEMVSQRVHRELRRTVSVGIGEVADSLAELPRSYREAKSALDARFLLGPNQIVTIQQLRGGRATATAVEDDAPRNRFLQALRAGLPQEASQALSELVFALRQRGDDREEGAVEMNRLLADTLNGLDALGVDHREIEALRENPFRQLSRVKTLEEMERWFRRVLEGASQLLDGRRQRHSEVKALAAERYIQEHYAERDLSLQTVCSALAVSKSYLSPIFKTHTGMTFVEYLTYVRMERAKLLLSSDDRKVYEIAEEVGFKDAHYFSLTFKKQLGKSPTEYRELAWQKGS